MLVRVSRLGEIAFVDRVVLAYRRHPAQLSQARRPRRWQPDAMHRSQVRISRKLLLAPENTPAQRRSAGWARWHACGLRLHWTREALAQGQWLWAARHAQRGLRMYARLAWDLAALLGQRPLANGRAGCQRPELRWSRAARGWMVAVVLIIATILRAPTTAPNGRPNLFRLSWRHNNRQPASAWVRGKRQVVMPATSPGPRLTPVRGAV